MKRFFCKKARVCRYILVASLVVVATITTSALCDSYSEVIDYYRTTFKYYNQVEEGMKSPYPLWTSDDRVTEIDNITKEKISNGLRFTGYDQDGNLIKAEFKKTGEYKGELELYYKGTKQLSYSEYFTEDHKCFLSISCPLKPENYLKVTVADPDTEIPYSPEKQYLIQIETMGEVITGKESANMDRLPVLDEVEQLRQELTPSPVKIAALNYHFLDYMAKEAGTESIERFPPWGFHILNHVAAVATDFIATFGVTIIAHIISELVTAEPLY